MSYHAESRLRVALASIDFRQAGRRPAIDVDDANDDDILTGASRLCLYNSGASSAVCFLLQGQIPR